MQVRKAGYPFSGKAETKTSSAGKEYLSIGIRQSVKQQDGTYKDVWVNMLNKNDLLQLAATATDLYNKVVDEEAKERFENKESSTVGQTERTTQDVADIADNIPFNQVVSIATYK